MCYIYTYINIYIEIINLKNGVRDSSGLASVNLFYSDIIVILRNERQTFLLHSIAIIII